MEHQHQRPDRDQTLPVIAPADLLVRVLFVLAVVLAVAMGLSFFETAVTAHTITVPQPPPQHFVSEQLTRGAWGVNDMLLAAGDNDSRVLGVDATWRAEAYSATVLRQSKDVITLSPGKAITVWVDVQNTGTAAWRAKTGPFVALNVASPAGRASAFRYRRWDPLAYRVLRIKKPVQPGGTVRLKFVLQAPKTEGISVEQFGLVAEDLTWIPGSTVSFTIRVGNPAPIQPTPVATSTGEPIVRVGVVQSDAPAIVQSTSAFSVSAGGATVFADTLGPITTTVTGQVAVVSDGVTSATVPMPVRFAPTADGGILEVPSFSNRPAWNTALNDNAFRGTLELRTPDAGGAPWLINELPIESYLRGLAEASEGSPPEYLKALIVAARSYATWHVLTDAKHPGLGFHVNATTDQVYRGYGFELRAPSITAAVEATRGLVMTHPAAVRPTNPRGVAFGAYSACTDGQTRDFTAVFGGTQSDYAWLTRVPDPDGVCTDARFLAGLDGNHMVGLSAAGARVHAERGALFQAILTTYYQGVTLTAW